MLKKVKKVEMSQITNKVNPAQIHTPQGFRRLKRGEILREGDLFFHCNLLSWCSAHLQFKENLYTNCIRPIRMLTDVNVEIVK